GATDDAERLHSAGDGVGAHRGELISQVYRRDPVWGDLGGREGQFADVPPAEVSHLEGILRSESVLRGGAETVPGVLTGEDGGVSAGDEFIDVSGHEVSPFREVASIPMIAACDHLMRGCLGTVPDCGN